MYMHQLILILKQLKELRQEIEKIKKQQQTNTNKPKLKVIK